MKVARTLRAFQRSDDFVRFIVGPVGSGKSSACIAEIPRRARRQRPCPDGVRRSRWAIVRNTYGQLRDTTRKTFEQWIPAGAGTWHEQSFTWHGRWYLDEAKTDLVECEVLFRALDRPEDVKKLLSLELTGAYINEVREIPKHVLDVLQTRVGRFPSKAQGGPSWFGIWADTNPWHSGHWGSKLFAKGLKGYRLFRQPGGRARNAENLSNLPAGYYDRLVAGKDREWVSVYVDGEDAAGDVGSILGPWISTVDARKGICAFDHGMDGVFTAWDLGRSDSTGIWFWRYRRDRSVDILDHYESAGEGLSHYFAVVDGKGYSYAGHWLPHDARAKTLATQRSVMEQCAERWPGKVGIVPQLSIADGIAAARWLLEQPGTQIHERCGTSGRLEHSGLDALREWRFEWDENEQVFSTNPLHNWASHSADAFRYLALVVKHSERFTRPEPPREDRIKAALRQPTLNELLESQPRPSGRI